MPALSSEVIVLIDVTDLNDNAPVFSQNVYEATVSELAPVATLSPRFRLLMLTTRIVVNLNSQLYQEMKDKTLL